MQTISLNEPMAIGPLMREWRTRRRRSQMDVALAVGVSPRHLSFVETGRSRPSPNTLLAMAEELDVPLRERNHLLMAAGYAPRFHERAITAGDMAGVRAAMQRLLDAHQPYPGMVLDRCWNVVLANSAAQALAGLLPTALTQPVLNVFRVGLHPQGLSTITTNFDQWGRYLLRELKHLAVDGADTTLSSLSAEVHGYATVKRLLAQDPAPTTDGGLLVPCVLELPFGRVSMFTTLTRFATPQDITLEELCIELFYPADLSSAELLRSAGAAGASAPR